jgi:hypothetical protein
MADQLVCLPEIAGTSSCSPGVVYVAASLLRRSLSLFLVEEECRLHVFRLGNLGQLLY